MLRRSNSSSESAAAADTTVGVRRRAREAALQLLYQAASGGGHEPGDVDLFWRSAALEPEGREFAEALFRGYCDRGGEIDRLIDEAAQNWRVDRIARIDLCVLRMAVCELLSFPETPVSVVIDEAVEIARRFSDEAAPAFVNGVLDRVARRVRAAGETSG
ncbi:MAG: transcription antitermination factor NusB [Deltaproteobacteria bacterium]|nr:MAG: transcription antitermination factor NusB [Deltaproteobacteria bacterium]